jgi:lipopolysaccharide/colanic/teichoic acid biosynthesis glycosyltransferase
MILRTLDLIISGLGLLLLFPLFIIIGILIKIESKGPLFYKQVRIGKKGHIFSLLKFRTMISGSDKSGLLTIGAHDPRITQSGRFLRKFKIDEIPQLLNVIKGEMSMVGPRPEVPKYVNLYNEEQKRVLSIKPGLTDNASIEFANENEILAKSVNPEKLYIENIMPRKIELNMHFINNPSVYQYFRILIKTFLRIIFI